MIEIENYDRGRMVFFSCFLEAKVGGAKEKKA